MGPSGLFLVIFILIMLSMFFSLAETAIVSTPEEKIFKMNEDGFVRARSALKVLSNKEKIVSISLLCDNLVNIVASSISAICFAEWFGQWDEIGILLSTIIMTILVFVFGEVLPKMIALRQPTKITLIISPLMLLLWKILYPIIWMINIITTKLVYLLHIKDEFETEKADDNILGAVEMYHKKGMIENEEKNMLSGILQLDETDMKDIMTHRNEMFAIDINDNLQTIINKAINTNFSKIPFYDKSDDNIIGVLYVIDLMRELHKNNNDIKNIDVRKLLHQPWFLPGDSSVESNLQEFKNRSSSIAFIVDEYGGIMGIVTLEDVLEEIVGDINNENEQNEEDCVLDSDGNWVINADTNLVDVNEKIGTNFENSDVSSIAGYLISVINKLPKKGEKFQIQGYNFKILEATKKRIKKISIKKIENNKINIEKNISEN